ncbi:hypothetical protein ACA910_017527 [Epithemia clementina (nom. ined.)]
MSGKEGTTSRYPRRRCQASGGVYAGQDSEGDSLQRGQEDGAAEDSNSCSSDDMVDSNKAHGRRGGKKVANSEVRRTSSRANKFQKSMAEPRLSDLLTVQQLEVKKRDNGRTRNKGSGKSSKRASKKTDDVENRTHDVNIENSDLVVEIEDHKKNAGADGSDGVQLAAKVSMEQQSACGSPDLSESDESSVDDDDGEEGGDDNPLKVQRIIGSKSLRCRAWKEICTAMNTSEVDAGSVWHQKEQKDDDMFEERFLVKWSDLSYLHCSWETAKDLEDQIENAKTYLNTFFRKSKDGFLFTPEQRCDGEYFDPAFTQIDRILELSGPDGYVPGPPEDEDKITHDQLGIVADKTDPEYEEGLGRNFLVKWCNQPYSECTYEWERDLIINNVEYKQHVKNFLTRTEKPTKQWVRSRLREGEATKRTLYKTFGDSSKLDEKTRSSAVADYQKSLREQVYKNGGQLRDYQAEGVSWMTANYVNKRSCILADEMGLGKTLQTAATLNIVATQIQHTATFLIIAPLSTIPHWLREFESWTDLNAIVYHGSAEDRQLIREYEMVYEADRPKNRGANYLRRCKRNKKDSPWMAQVVVATPEMLVTEDAFELSEIKWDILVVDEAHRLKNHNSKLAVTMRDARFEFGFKILCTGTPIQNDMKELWTLLHFIDRDAFGSMNDFLEKYGDMKSKETVDELHDQLRPYILRRLKEDVEKSMPPKEETIIEVELTLSQKQYYRALYEKNVKFLHKGKSKALDGPSLSNLAMQLRKCCNHVCLLNGIEAELRKQHASMTDSDFLVKGSGKLVLLDKLLPRLMEEGHRVLIFSQFKIMLDILEDYLEGRKMSFGRIDGSITGLQRQLAIDRFQSREESAPFIMMLSTRAGGVGINLTAADTVIIFDSDWNPQNDLQAQARCHRIGQERAVKVYRLLSARTYEMQMFNLSSMKMGLDQAVLQGIENSSGDGALSKTEIETLLKHGAYAIITEEKDGKSEKASTEFVEQDIDSILERRTRTIVHDGSKGGRRGGGTFSKASFKVAKSPNKSPDFDDVDVDDPDFWKKMLGDSLQQSESTYLDPKQRRKAQKNYAEQDQVEIEKTRSPSPVKNDRDDVDYTYESEASSDSNDDDESYERTEWGESKTSQWTKEQVEQVERFLYSFGYGNVDWDVAMRFMRLSAKGQREIKRMSWSIVLTILIESAQSDVCSWEKRAQRNAEKQRESTTSVSINDGGILAAEAATVNVQVQPQADMIEMAFQKLWSPHDNWARQVIEDAIEFARGSVPRKTSVVTSKPSVPGPDKAAEEDLANEEFVKTVWDSLKTRGWKIITASEDAESPLHGRFIYSYRNETYDSIDKAVRRARLAHPELSQVLDSVVDLTEGRKRRNEENLSKQREDHLLMTPQSVTFKSVQEFLRCYAPLQLVVDRETTRSLSLSRRALVSIPLMSNAFLFIQKAQNPESQSESKKQLSSLLNSRPKSLPHPEWTNQHDIVLLRAIYKHGFVELESNYRGMLSDKSIVWGPPFDSIPSRSSSEVAACKAKLDEMLGVAKRAEEILQKMPQLEETKYINTDMLAVHFCLERVVEGNNSLAITGGFPWKLNQSALIAKYGRAFGNVEVFAAELPSKKELTKRAKVLLGSLLSSASDKESADQQQDQPKSLYGYAVLDQTERANFLLAEFLRGFLKAPVHSKEGKEVAKTLCVVALKEAQQRASDAQRFGRCHNFSDKQLKQKCDIADRIIKQIQLVEASLSLPARLYKNIVRAMLGEAPFHGKSSGEPLFPGFKTSVRKDPPPTTGTIQRSYGHRAIKHATLRKLQVEDGSCLKSGKNTLYLFMTAVETVILSAACNHGLPVWKSEWHDLVSVDSKSSTQEMTWREFGQRLEKDVVNELSPMRPESSWESQCYEQILEYKAEPETLAKKTILMLAKLLQKIAVATPGLKSEHGLSSKVVKWFSDQVVSWSFALQLVDQANEPLALTAVDFLEDVSNEEKTDVCLVSCFDKQACRDMFCQIASVSKLRAVFLLNDSDTVLAMTQQAIMNLDRNDGEWRGCLPTNWNHGADDTILLKRLLNVGMRGLALTSTAGSTLQNLKLNELILNLRVNELVSEFYEFEQAGGGIADVRLRGQESTSSRTEVQPELAMQRCHAEADWSGESKRKIAIVDDGESLKAVMADKKTRFV